MMRALLLPLVSVAAAVKCGDRVVGDVVLDADLECGSAVGLEVVNGTLHCGWHTIAFTGESVNGTIGVLHDGTGDVQNCKLTGWGSGVSYSRISGQSKLAVNVTGEDVGKLLVIKDGQCQPCKPSNLTVIRGSLGIPSQSVVLSGLHLSAASAEVGGYSSSASNIVLEDSTLSADGNYVQVRGVVGRNSTLSGGAHGASYHDVLMHGGSLDLYTTGAAGTMGGFKLFDTNASIAGSTPGVGGLSAVRCEGSPMPTLAVSSDGGLSGATVMGVQGTYSYGSAFYGTKLRSFTVRPLARCPLAAWSPPLNPHRSLLLPQETLPAKEDDGMVYGWDFADSDYIRLDGLSCEGPSDACFRVPSMTSDIVVSNITLVGPEPPAVCSTTGNITHVKATLANGKAVQCKVEP